MKGLSPIAGSREAAAPFDGSRFQGKRRADSPVDERPRETTGSGATVRVEIEHEAKPRRIAPIANVRSATECDRRRDVIGDSM
jgi:hypothetical protein